MGHHQPQFLWFLLLGLIPLVIHLIMRLRVRRVRWGATYLLERAIARLEDEEKWKYYLLFATRTLVGLAVAYAFARPFLRHSEGGTLASQNVHHVILVDNSYSTTFAKGEQSVFDNGLRLLRAVVERWPRGEMVSIYTLAGGLEAVVERQRTEDGRKLMEHLARLRVRDGRVDTARAVQEVRRRGAGERLEIILVGDAQASNWESARRMQQPMADGPALWLLPGPAAEPNLSLTTLTVPGQTIVKDDLVQVVARVQCSRQARDPQPVTCELTLPGEGTQRKTATVLPGRFKDVPFDVRLHQAGYNVLKVEIKTRDGLVWDNAITAGVLVKDRLRIGVCAEIPARAFENAADFLAVAATDGADSMGLAVTGIPDIETAALGAFDVVALDNPAGLDGKRQATLEAFVRRGGGLIVFAGPNLTPSSSASQAAFWPARCGAAPTVLPTSGVTFWRVQLSSLEHPCFQALNTHDADGLSGVKVFGYWPAVLAAGAEPLARFDNGDLWMAGRKLGFGRVLMMTSGLSGIWNNLPVLSGYAHFVHRSIGYVTAGLEAPLNVRRGDEIVALDPADALTVLVGPLGGSEETVSYVLASGVREGRPVKIYAGTVPRNGLYALRTVIGGRTDERFVSVYDDRLESEVAPLDAEGESRVVEQFGWRILRDEAEVRRYLAESTGGREAYVWLIGLLLALLFAESWLTWKVGA